MSDRTGRRGLSLLEVMLAIAIFGGAVAVIGELIRMGVRSATEARELTTAQLLCESKMAEVAAGILPQEPLGLTPIDTSGVIPEWYFTVEVIPTEREGLLAVQVLVLKNPDLATTQPISFSLVRWMKDATLVRQGVQDDLAIIEAAAASAASNSSSATNSGTVGEPGATGPGATGGNGASGGSGGDFRGGAGSDFRGGFGGGNGPGGFGNGSGGTRPAGDPAEDERRGGRLGGGNARGR